MHKPLHSETPLVIGSASDALERACHYRATRRYDYDVRSLRLIADAAHEPTCVEQHCEPASAVSERVEPSDRTPVQRAHQVRRPMLIVIALPVLIAIGVPLLLWLASMATQ